MATTVVGRRCGRDGMIRTSGDGCDFRICGCPGVSLPISFPSVVLSIQTHVILPPRYSGQIVIHLLLERDSNPRRSTPSPGSPQSVPSHPQSTSVTDCDDHGDSYEAFPVQFDSDSNGLLETDIVKTGMGSSNVDPCALAHGEECEMVFVGSCCVGWGGGRRRRRQR